MKHLAFVLALTAGSAAVLHAADAPELTFPDRKIGHPPLSLRESLKPGAPTPPAFRFTPSIGRVQPHAARDTSRLPIVEPRTDVDFKLVVVPPNAAVDFKILVKDPQPDERPASLPQK